MSTATPDTTTGQEVDISLLENLDFDHTPKCDNDLCDNDATHLIRCHCGKGTEFSCIACINQMLEDARTAPLIGGLIKFDPNKSCGHLSLITACSVTPL